MNNNHPLPNEEFEQAKQRIEQLEQEKQSALPEVFDSEFIIDEDLGANYYRKLTTAFKDFCTAFQLPFTDFSIIEEDKVSGNYLRQSQSEEVVVVFKLKNLFPPISVQKSAQLDIVVAQSCNQNLPSKFNLRFTNNHNADTFSINQCKVIVFEKTKLSSVVQKSKFWITMANL